MQLIISPILSKEDAKAIRDASSNVVQNVIEKSINRELDSIESEFEKDHVGALSYLLKKEFLEIRIDIPKDENGNPKKAGRVARGTFRFLNERACMFCYLFYYYLNFERHSYSF